MATQLLIFALEKGMIDGALITRMAKGNPTKPDTFLARTKEDIIAASKSKYCPVAANEGLKKLLKENGRFAVVGLPCHIHGVRKAEKMSTALNKKIALRIGLLCSHMTSFEGMEFLLKKLGVEVGDVTEISYRGSGWPGSMTIHVRNGSVKTIPLFGSWKAYWPIYSSFFFTPFRCTMCPDQAAELADISLGDAWLPEFKSDKIGKSIIVSRTKRGDDLLQLAKSAHSISIKAIPVSKVEQSQAVNMTFKKIDLPNRLYLAGLFGRETPKFNVELCSAKSVASILRSIFVYCGIKTSANRTLRSMLVRLPFPLFRVYYGIYKYLSRI
jgi:coenzyme F420 hydrogenase subunit beta